MRVLIANRGEVAVRIIRACQELGHTSILIHSTPDKKTLAYRMADECVELPGQTPLETYLNIPLVVDAAKKAKADFVHPGFGFLSENASFVKELEKEKIGFVGPTSASILLAGNKVKAKELAKKAGVPTVPAFTDKNADLNRMRDEAEKIGFPCIIKPAHGGGGKGMKVVHSKNEFEEQFLSAQREAEAAFGSKEIFLEKYLSNPRHVEVQILFDRFGHGIHLYERDCSIQRRHQKIFEESPSTALNARQREDITQAALRIGQAAMYSNAGTVEFLLDDQGKFYFMELNTRLQVEHTVTEMVTGLDLVHLQLQVAMRQEAPQQKEVIPRGHALEVRVYAEDPSRGFLPSTGVISDLILPHGPGRRFDFGIEAGDEITPFYDPMIGKIITFGATRKQCLDRMLATLKETVIFGVHTNIEFLKSVLTDSDFARGEVSTSFLQKKYSDGFTPEAPTEEEKKLVLKATAQVSARETYSVSSPWHNTELS